MSSTGVTLTVDNAGEFKVISEYIEKHCGIRLTAEKTYLLKTRLTSLMAETGCSNFSQLHSKAVADKSNSLRDKIVDAMTTNETLWFRDSMPYQILREVLLPELAAPAARNGKSKLRIWSAASSTGQEPYSIAITINELMRTGALRTAPVEIIATDISPTALFLASAARYDSLAITRGLPQDIKTRYFTQEGNVWALNSDIKKMVTFRRFNLQDNFGTLGNMDIVFCRNVLIYFSEAFKKDILSRMAALLRPRGYLFLGASESIISYSNEYEMLRHRNGIYYRVK